METSRRNILKIFGVTSIAVALPTAAEAERVYNYTPPPAPEGMTYQWKRIFIMDDVPDIENIVEMVQHGWKPVPASRHREVYPDNGSYWVEIGGMVLMEKPTKDIPAPVACPTPFVGAPGKLLYINPLGGLNHGH